MSTDLELIPLGLDAARRLATDPHAFAGSAGVDFGPHAEVAREVAAQTVAHRERAGDAAPWGSYLAVVASSRTVIGTCAFVSAPEGGAVEIAYFTFQGGEGRGLATAMARALVDVARTSRQVRAVRAHTLPADGPSPGVLRKLGFQRAGEVQDPDEGMVWRWELALP
jgi:RimJ/RimL family protein N-acetyltransferase